MKESDVKKIENKLEIKLPDSYRKVILKRKRHRNALLNDYKILLEINEKYRNEGVKGKDWPMYYFIIGYRPDYENVYFINIKNSKNEKVYFLTEEQNFNPKSVGQLIAAEDLEEHLEFDDMIPDVD